MGYIEETGAAQHYRDARIAPIYEGTNGIQAIDLVGRKLGLRGGAAIADFLDAIDGAAEASGRRRRAGRLGDALADGVADAAEATAWILAHGADTRRRVGRRHAVPAHAGSCSGLVARPLGARRRRAARRRRRRVHASSSTRRW